MVANKSPGIFLVIDVMLLDFNFMICKINEAKIKLKF